MALAHDNVKWWEEREDRAQHETFWEAWDRARAKNNNRRAMLAHASTLYDDAGMADLAPSIFELSEAPQTLALNVVRQVVDTVTSKMSKNRPLPKAITFGGSYRQRRRARDLSDFFAGDLDNAGVFNELPFVIRDALWAGTGLSLDFEHEGEILHARLHPWEHDVDPREAQHGIPRTHYITKWFDRDVLRELYVKDDTDESMAIDEAITAAANSLKHSVWDPGKDDLSDVIPVGIGIHLPSGKNATDGRLVMGISTRILSSKPYTRQNAPVNKLCFSEPIAGYYGDGIPHLIEGLQYGLLDMSLKWQEANYLTPTGIVAVQEDDSFTLERIGNTAWQEARYRGPQPPTFQTLPAADAGLVNGIQMLVKWCFDFSGLSQLSAQSQKDPSLKSGKSIREFSDFETERFLQFGRQIEKYVTDVAWSRYDLREETQAGRKVRAYTKRFGRPYLRDIDWSEIKADRSEFRLRVFSTNLLAQTPSARREDLEDMVNAGFLSIDEAKAAIFGDDVDTDALGALEAASTEIVDAICEHLLTCDATDSEQYIYPEPEFNLDLCLKRGTKHLTLATLNHLSDPASEDPANIDLLATWLEDVRAEKAKAEQPPAGAMSGAPPGAPPMPGPGGPPPPPDMSGAPPGVPPAPPPPMGPIQ